MNNFEYGIKRLEEVSNLLEEEKNLDKALEYFNEGIKICEECKNYLEQANAKVLEVENKND